MGMPIVHYESSHFVILNGLAVFISSTSYVKTKTPGHIFNRLTLIWTILSKNTLTYIVLSASGPLQPMYSSTQGKTSQRPRWLQSCTINATKKRYGAKWGTPSYKTFVCSCEMFLLWGKLKNIQKAALNMHVLDHQEMRVQVLLSMCWLVFTCRSHSLQSFSVRSKQGRCRSHVGSRSGRSRS